MNRRDWGICIGSARATNYMRATRLEKCETGAVTGAAIVKTKGCAMVVWNEGRTRLPPDIIDAQWARNRQHDASQPRWSTPALSAATR